MLRKILCCAVFLACAAAAAWAETVKDALAAARMKDYVRAAEILKPLAERGDTDAQADLGALYLQGVGVPRNVPLAIRLLTLAADKGNGVAQTDLGQAYNHGVGVARDDAKAAALFSAAAHQGRATAQGALGFLYWNGQGVPKNLPLAYVWLSLASGRDFPAADQNLLMLKPKMSGGDMARAEAILKRCRANLKVCG